MAMADEFQLGSGNWWDTSRHRFDSGTTSTSASISTTLNTLANRAWPESETPAAPGGGSPALHGGALPNPDLQIMGLGLSSPAMDWNVPDLLRGEKGEGSFRSILEEDANLNTSNFQQDLQINRGLNFSKDQSHFSQSSSNDSTITSQNLTGVTFSVDSAAAAYGLLMTEKQHHEGPPMSYPHPSSGYGSNFAELVPSWNKFQAAAMRQPPPPLAFGSSSHLPFANSTPPFWNTPTAMSDARSSFPQSSQVLSSVSSQVQSFDEKPKHASEMRNLSTATKKNTTEASNKRPRSETPSPLPAFKVKKEKMGDRITALQQLVSPFGKTDTASVLSEAIEYIKFLHEQVGALSAPYMKIGAPMQHQQVTQNSEKSKDPEGGRHDLRSRGLCLVPVSSTFPVTNETTVDFWTPTFGGSYR